MTILHAAAAVLRELGQAHYRTLAREIKNRGLAPLAGKTPATTVNASISSDINRRGGESEFVRLEPGTYGLREERMLDHSPESSAAEPKSAKQQAPMMTVRQAATEVLKELGEAHYRTVAREIQDRGLARLGGKVPEDSVRKVFSSDILSHGDNSEFVRLKPAIFGLREGRILDSAPTEPPSTEPQQEKQAAPKMTVRQAASEVLKEIGPAHYETIAREIQERGLARLSGKVPGSTVRSRLSSEVKHHGESSEFVRLNPGVFGLRKAGVLDHSSEQSSSTEQKLAYSRENPAPQLGSSDLDQSGDRAARSEQRRNELLAQVQQQSDCVRVELGVLLGAMNPFAFERLIKRLLVRMGYQNVHVTKQSGDGGVDVTAEMKAGISSVTEVVQAKRHKRAIQRSVLDELRGSLHRFGARQGTIITTSKFTKGTRESANEAGAAPITLIDGEQLIDQLIEYRIGVRKDSIEILTVLPEEFEDLQPDD